MIARCSIIPPNVLSRIAANGNAAQRDAALSTLATDQTMRLVRATYQLMESGAHKVLMSAAPAAKQRTVYDAQHREALPGRVVRTEGAAAGKDAAVNEAYDGLGATYDFYAAAYDRNSIDDEGMHLDASVHYGTRYDNAFWNGQQMVFGDGDGDLFNRFTAALDVIAHELTHGVTGDEARLVYTGEAGALNESVSDVFGSLVKQHARGQKAQDADWLIGQGLFTSKVRGIALRSMKAPGTANQFDRQPKDMDGFVVTNRDNGGVHTNSGIPNKAFYLAATALGGFAWETAGRIWYAAMNDARLRPNSRFAAFAQATIRAATTIGGGADSDAAKAVTEAWRTVKVL